jgi:UDP-N-acetylmuramoyl-L-alanine---L-glutamate ligase
MSVRFSELDGATVGVWGAGREIRSFAEQLARRLPSARIAVAAFDTLPSEDIPATLSSPEVRVLTGAGAVAALAECDLVVRSPGVSIHRPEMRSLAGAGVPVTTATALWLGEREGRGVVGVTGTKGKSTTAALIFHLARAAGAEAHLAGNIGVPALDLLDRGPTDMAVVELSSYQIADLATGPAVAVITNLFREHADWHGSEQTYRAEKLRILGLPGVRTAVLNGRDPQLSAAVPDGVAVVPYGRPESWDVVAGGIAAGGEIALAAAELPLPGEHNALNLCAALAALEAFGITPPPLRDALRDFRALPHRLETVGQADEILWVDDSISTTPESTLAALSSFPDHEIVLIAGGQDRGQDHGELARALAARSATVIGVPSTGARLLAAVRAAGVPAERAIEAADLRAAVQLARDRARPGSVILLSPAAPSYDNYRDFEERGERFRSLAAAPQEGPAAPSARRSRR